MWNMLAEAVQSPALPALPGLPELAGLGSAGLMGAMWLWERRNSRTREQQLDESHQRIMNDRVQLDQLLTVIRQNSEALARLCAMLERR